MKTITFNTVTKNVLTALLVVALVNGTGCKKECNTMCQNGGSLVEENCTCNCPGGFTGDLCQTRIMASCSLSGSTTIWNSLDGQSYVNEAENELPAGHFLTGVGLSTGSTTINTLMVKGRKLNSDCTLGAESEFRDGSQPSGSLEKQWTVPYGYAITGVGVGISGSTVVGLKVYYRKLIAQADGSWRLGSELSHTEGSGIDRITSVTNYSSFDLERHLLAGFGAVNYNSDVLQVWARVRKLNP